MDINHTSTSAAIAFNEGGATIRILRSGTFTSSEGQKITFRESDLAAIAERYDATQEPAPLVKGHPKTDDPAHGWVSGLQIQGGQLVASADQLDANFVEDVRVGRFKRVSASLYGPDHPNNPRPGHYYLKHVGFLGAHAPAIRGLGTVSLAAFEAVEDGLIHFSEEPKEKELMPDEPKPADNAAPNNIDPAAAASFAERQAQLDKREQDIAQREAEQLKAVSEAAHAANVSFAETMVAAHKLAPAGKDKLVIALDALGGDKTASFGEAKDVTPRDALKALFDGAQPLVNFGEQSAAPKGAPKTASFAAPRGYEVDQDRGALHARAKALQAANSELSFAQAVAQAQAEA